jgi:hypothetical protein
MAVHTPIPSRRRGVPPWSVLVTTFVALVAGVYFVTNLIGENPAIGVEPTPPVGPDPVALIGEGGCQACHGADLGGAGAFPSLLELDAGPISENLQDLALEHPDEWIHLWIDGTGPEVAGLDRRGMPAYGGPPYEFTDEEIDAIVAYVRALQQEAGIL